MGKLIQYLSLLIFIDLMFLIFVPFSEVSPSAIVIKGMIYGLSTGTDSGSGLGNSTSAGSWGYVSNKFFCLNNPTVPDTSFSIDYIKNLNACNKGSLIYLLLGIIIVGFIITTKITVGGVGVQPGLLNLASLMWIAVGTVFYLNIGIDFVTIFNYMKGINPPFTNIIALIIFIPLAILYGLTLIEWMKGTD